MARATLMPQTINEALPSRGLSCYFGSHLDAGSVGAREISSLFCVTDAVGWVPDNLLALWRAEQVYRPRTPQGQCIGDVGMKATIQVYTPVVRPVPDQSVFWDRVQAALGPKAASCATPIPSDVLFCYA